MSDNNIYWIEYFDAKSQTMKGPVFYSFSMISSFLLKRSGRYPSRVNKQVGNRKGKGADALLVKTITDLKVGPGFNLISLKH
jgi:hypothetical protein